MKEAIIKGEFFHEVLDLLEEFGYPELIAGLPDYKAGDTLGKAISMCWNNHMSPTMSACIIWGAAISAQMRTTKH